MRNKRLIIVMSCAVVFGLAAAVLVSRYLANAQAYSKNLNSVMVARADIPAGTKLESNHLVSAQFPQGATPEGTFNSTDKLVGRVTITNIGAREPITDFRLAPEGSVGGLSAVIPEGYRAMTVKVDDAAGISGFILPGTIVDVVVVISPDQNSSGQNPISKIVLQNIKVLANGQNIDRPKDDREAESVKAVTLQVLPEEAEKLALASNEGKLQLVMRNSVDQGDEKTKGVDKRRLLGGDLATPIPDPGSLKSERPAPVAPVRRVRTSNAPVVREEKPAVPAPVAPPPPRPSIEMIEGVKKRSVDFP